jgi:hypothetical protein
VSQVRVQQAVDWQVPMVLLQQVQPAFRSQPQVRHPWPLPARHQPVPHRPVHQVPA